jgi:serine/threonine protein kinase
MLAAGRHPNLVALRGWYRDAEGMLCLVLEYCAGGTLEDLLQVRFGYLKGLAPVC